jgi:hypothetical protein
MPPIQFQCAVAQAFNFKRDVQVTLGHMTSCKIASTTDLAKDMEVLNPKNPTAAAAGIVAVLSSFYWGAGHADPMQIACQISTPNRQNLVLLLQKDLVDTTCEFQITIYQFDPIAKLYFIAFQSANNAVLKGLIGKSGEELMLQIGDSPGEVQSPENWPMMISLNPQTAAQDVQFATADTKNVVKKWGVTVGKK